jgi:IclR family transcriptional regulator, acetate operon repressor
MATHAQPVQALSRGLRLLEALADVSGRADGTAGIVELARATDLSQATVHRLVATLMHDGYIARAQIGSRYRLGPRLFALATIAEARLATVLERAAPVMESLRDRFGETVNLAVLDRRHIIYVYQVQSDRPVRAFTRVGNRVLAHATAAGKILLASEPDAVLETLIPGEKLEPLTPATIASGSKLRGELQRVRELGYALDLGEQDEEVICVAAAVPVSGLRPAGALSLSGPAGRMRGLDLAAVATELAQVAARVSSR